MRTRRSLQAISLALGGVFLAVSLGFAQVPTSTMTGSVTDAQGLLVSGAKVVAKNEATGVTYETATTTAGTYAISSLPPGLYTITVTQQGFKTFTSRKNELHVGAPLVVDAKLDVGQLSEVVQVESSYQKIEATNAMLSGVVGRKEIGELPLNGRNPLNLIIFEPGLVQRSTGAAGSGTHVFGSRDRAHNVTIDGIDANESSVPNPQSNIYRLTPDNVQEYRVVTHNATPEFGRNSGANVTIATRSGTSEFHGDAYYFHRNTVLNSNEFFNNAAGQERPLLLLHQFGGDIGGPILRERTFFFFSYQGNRIKQTQPISQSFGIPTVYTASAKSGIFRYVKGTITLPDGSQITQNDRRLVDRTTGNLVSGVSLCSNPASDTNCIATYNMFANDPAGIGADALMKPMIDSFPNPNNFSSVGDGLNTAGFLWNTPSRFKGPFFLIRGDHKFNDSHNIFARMLWNNYDTTEGDLLNGRPALFPGFPPLGEVFRSGQNLAISYRAVLSPKVVNEFTTGYSRFNFFFSLAESNLQGGAQVPFGQECFGTDSTANIDTPFCNTPHTQRAVSTIQFIDNLSYNRGSHSYKTGFNFRLYRHNDSRGVPGGLNIAPTIVMRTGDRNIGTLPSAPPGITSSDRGILDQAMVEFMGVVSQVNQVYQADLTNDVYTTNLYELGTRVKHFDVYGQDEWKLRRNLTMTYGLRWERKLPGKDCCNRVFVPDRDVLGSQGPVTYVPADSWWSRNNWNTFAPRVSLAWDPWSNGKTVVRAGWGLAFDTLSTFQVTSIGGKVPGSVNQCFTRITSTNLTGTPSAGCPFIPATANGRVNELISALSPFTLPIPTTKPSQGFSPGTTPAGTAPSVGAFDPNLRVPTVHEWDLTIQRELPWGFVGQVGYVGKRGIRLYRAYDINQIFTNQPGFLQSFLTAQQNLFNGCDADGTVAGSSTAACPNGTPPTLLLALASASFLNGSTSRNNFLNNALGALAARIDSNTGTGNISTRIDPATGMPFPANYFRPNAQFSDIFYFDSGGSSIYHGLIMQLNRRFQQGLTFNLSYTFSKSIDDMSVDPVAATSGGGLSTTNSRTPTDVRNFRLDRTVSDFDNRHVITANVLYELPFGKGRRWTSSAPGWVDHIIGGWTVTSIFTRLSGEPFTLLSGNSTTTSSRDGRTVHNNRQSFVDVRGPMVQPSLFEIPGVGPVVYNLGPLITNPTDPNRGCKNVLNPDGTATATFFCIPAPGEHGNSGRNSVYGPGFWNVDLGILKNFSVTERIKLQFRTEMFNAFNHTNFDNPRNASDGSPSILSSLFGQTCCVASAIASSTTVIANGEPNRVIQFALRVSF